MSPSPTTTQASAAKAPASTSTTAPGLIRFKVRRVDPELFALRVESGGAVTLADGRVMPMRVGDFRIIRGPHTLDVVSPERFAKEFEPTVTVGLELTARECDAISERLGLGATQDADRLIAAIDRLASVRIGDIRIPFTPGQVAELQHRAAKRGRTVEMELRAVVSRIEEEIFHRGG